MRSTRASTFIAVVALACAVTGVPSVAWSQVPESSAPRTPGDELWDPGTNWVSLRAGYAKSTARGAGHGGVGYGFGFAHMMAPMKIWRWTLFKQFSIGGYIHHEMIDHFSNSAEIEVPATLELVRHLNWKTPFRPYLGFGAGQFYRKAYRTGADTRNVNFGGYLAFGANSPIGGRHILGFDARLIRVDSSYIPPNPVFGEGAARARLTSHGPELEPWPATHWSAKINYTIAY